MYYLLSALSGVVISIMIAINGNLTVASGILSASVIIHIVGSLFSFLLIRLGKKRLNFSRDIPAWFFLGGIVGVGSTVFNNLAFGRISMTSIVALGLLGQTIASILIDNLGLFGMKKRPIGRAKLPGLALSFGGMALMCMGTDALQILAIAVSFAAGITVVLARTVNSRLSDRVGALQGSFYNHIVGLPLTVALFLLFGGSEPFYTAYALPGQWWAFTGGCFGVVTVLLFNITVPRVRMLDLTFLSFVGEVFTGIVIDLILKQGFSSATFWGGVMVAAGLMTGFLIEYAHKAKPEGA